MGERGLRTAGVVPSGGLLRSVGCLVVPLAKALMVRPRGERSLLRVQVHCMASIPSKTGQNLHIQTHQLSHWKSTVFIISMKQLIEIHVSKSTGPISDLLLLTDWQSWHWSDLGPIKRTGMHILRIYSNYNTLRKGLVKLWTSKRHSWSKVAGGQWGRDLLRLRGGDGPSTGRS